MGKRMRILVQKYGGGKMTPQEVRDALLSLPDNERKFIVTDPATGEHKILSLRRNADGWVEYDFEGIPE